MNNDLRIKALESIFHAKSGHPGGVLSCIDIIEHLFSSVLRLDFNKLELLEHVGLLWLGGPRCSSNSSTTFSYSH